MTDTLANVRKIAGLTQQQVADRAGVPRPLIAMLEAGSRSMPNEVARSLAHVYKRSPEELMKLHEENRLVAGLKSLAKADGASLKAAAKSDPEGLLTTMRKIAVAAKNQPQEIQDTVSEIGERVLRAINGEDEESTGTEYTTDSGTVYRRDSFGIAHTVHKSAQDSPAYGDESDVYYDKDGRAYRRNALGVAREVK